MDTPSMQYMAGFFDGEGSITLRGKKTLIVAITQKDEDILRCYEHTFGGFICYQPKRKLWQWQISTINARKALETLLPFLYQKKHRAALGILWQNTMRQGQPKYTLSQYVIELRSKIISRMCK